MSSFAGALSNVSGSITKGLDNLLGRENESSRQVAARDGKYIQNLTSFFELETPTGNFLFPFVYNFQSTQLASPFAVEPVPTLDSGLVVHRSGVVLRRLQLTGNTGFKPHDLPMPYPIPFSASLLPLNYSDRNLQKKAFDALSGQRHLQYLDETLRIYSSLLIDRTTAAKTKLCFHCPQDDDHWQVEPANFVITRSASSPLTYQFMIDLLIIGPATPQTFPVEDRDKGFLANIQDAVLSVNKALGGLRAAVNDLTAVQGSFRILAYQTAGIISQANTIIDAANAFVEGTSLLIDVPLVAVKQLFQTIEKTLALYVQIKGTGTALADWPRVVRSRFRAMQNSINSLLMQPQTFQVPLNERLRSLNAQRSATPPSSDVLAATSFAAIQRNGTASLPGDATLSGPLSGDGPATPTYQSVVQVTVRQGDTLASIAQRALGSASQWKAIAVLNNISAPYTVAAGLTITSLDGLRDNAGVLVPGQILLAPSTAAPPVAVQTPEVVGVSADAPQDEQTFGRDLALVPRRLKAGRAMYGLALVPDAEGGQDIATVAGADNLRQQLTTQVTTRRGSNVLYPSVGMDRVVGSGLASADITMANYRITQALTRSARIQSIEALDQQIDGTTTYVSATLRTIAGSRVQVQAAL